VRELTTKKQQAKQTATANRMHEGGYAIMSLNTPNDSTFDVNGDGLGFDHENPPDFASAYITPTNYSRGVNPRDICPIAYQRFSVSKEPEPNSVEQSVSDNQFEELSSNYEVLESEGSPQDVDIEFEPPKMTEQSNILCESSEDEETNFVKFCKDNVSLPVTKTPVIDAVALVFRLKVGCHESENPLAIAVTDHLKFLDNMREFCPKQRQTTSDDARIKALTRWFEGIPTKRERRHKQTYIMTIKKHQESKWRSALYRISKIVKQLKQKMVEQSG